MPNFDINDFFKQIFYPATPDSPTYERGETVESCLSTLKQMIESNFEETREGMNDLWDENNYERFVSIMLHRAEPGSPPEGGPHPSYNAGKRIAVPDTTRGVTSDGTPAQGSIPFADVFCQTVERFRIVEFIEPNPFDDLSAALLWDVSRVVGQIKDQSSSEADPDRFTETYKHITAFAAVLKTYLRFLGSSSTNPDSFPDGFYLAHSDSEEADCQGTKRTMAWISVALGLKRKNASAAGAIGHLRLTR